MTAQALDERSVTDAEAQDETVVVGGVEGPRRVAGRSPRRGAQMLAMPVATVIDDVARAAEPALVKDSRPHASGIHIAA